MTAEVTKCILGTECGAVLPKDWQEAFIVPLYKGKEDQRRCADYKGINLLSVPGKFYGRVLIPQSGLRRV